MPPTEPLSTRRSESLQQRQHVFNANGLKMPFVTSNSSNMTSIVRGTSIPVLHSQVVKFGFLIGWESLLSTRGTELGMLEDLEGAVKWLNSQVRCKLVLQEGIVSSFVSFNVGVEHQATHS